MRNVIRAALALYLCFCCIPILAALPTWLRAPGISAYALCALSVVFLAGAVFLVLAPRIGRWVAILSQVPQILCLAAPGYYFCIFSGFIATVGFSILPDGQHWVWRPEFAIRGGTSAGLIFGATPTPEAGFAVILNVGAVMVALLAFYGLREKKSGQVPQSAVGGAPVVES